MIFAGRQRMIAAGAAGLILLALIALVGLRWPRLHPDRVLVTHSEDSGIEMSLEYRMPRPFSVELNQILRTSVTEPPNQTVPQRPHIRIGGWSGARTQDLGTFQSRYDPLRGEHYVRLRFTRGDALGIEIDGQRIAVSPWSAASARSAEWKAPARNGWVGAGTGIGILRFNESEQQEEHLILYAY